MKHFQLLPLILSIFLPFLYLFSQTESTREVYTPLAYHEAEILVYVMPDAERIRNLGGDVAWIGQSSPEMNQEHYYHFYVSHTLEPTVSPLVGHFAVNKFTADVWSTVPEPKLVTSRQLSRIQEILREAHGIDESTIRKYRDKSVWTNRQEKAPEPASRRPRF